MKEFLTIEVSWKTLWRVAIFTGLVLLFFLAREVVWVFLIAVVISMGLDPLVSFFGRFKVPRILGTLGVFLGGVLIVSTILYLIVPVIVLEAGGFLAYVNKTVSAIFGFSIPETLLKNFTLTLNQALQFLNAAHVSVSGAIGEVMRRVILVAATVVISFYLTMEREGVERFLRIILPDAYEPPVLKIFGSFKEKIRHWFIAQLGLSVVVGISVGVGMWLLGVRYPLILGVLAAVFELVPLIGPILVGVVAFLVAIADSLSLGLYSLLFFFLFQQFENHVLVPIVLGKTINVHPVLVIVALLAGAQVAGFVGVILAVPLALLGQELLEYIADQRKQKETAGL